LISKFKINNKGGLSSKNNDNKTGKKCSDLENEGQQKAMMAPPTHGLKNND
jgi:hypothetical protein